MTVTRLHPQPPDQPQDDKPTGLTVKAVLAYAKLTNEDAERKRAGDPYADPYTISENGARILSQRHGPERAIEIIRERRVAKDVEQRERDETSARSLARLQRRQRRAQADRDAERRGLSVGQRIDRALRQLEVASEAATAQLDGDRVKGSVERGVPRLSRDHTTYETQKRAAHDFAGDIEDVAERARRRRVEELGDAA